MGVEGWPLVGVDIWGGEYKEWSGREERRGKREEVERVGASRRGRAVRSESSRERESKV
jgi:hypothetical protein